MTRITPGGHPKAATFICAPPAIDFSSDRELASIVAEGERLGFGHLVNPAFATEVARIDPLPHQRIAVYGHMLTQYRLRFLLADNAGAGKTFMTGPHIREMLSRRLLPRVLIVPPAGLAGVTPLSASYAGYTTRASRPGHGWGT